MAKSRKTRVLVVCQHFYPETFRITDVCEAFVERGYEVDVLCGLPNYPSGKIFPDYGFFKNRRQTYKGIHIYRAWEIPRGNNTNLRILLNYISYTLCSSLYVFRLLFRDYDRVFVYQLSPITMSWPGIIIAKLKRKKLFIYVCDFWPHSLFSIINFKNKCVIKLITSFSYWHYRRADGVIGAFKGIQSRLISEVGLPPEKTLYITQAAEKIYESPVKDASLAKRFKGRFTVVFAGSINPAQSFDTVIDAAEITKKKGYKDFVFVIVGDGMSKNWLVKEVEKRGLADQFAFEGFMPFTEVPRYQTMADVLLVALTRSKLFEYGIPAKVQSYMPAGKPILGAMDGDGKDLINNSGSGICVESGDSRGLARGLMRLMDMSTKERSEMGKKARDYHFRHFERNYNMDRLVDYVFNDKRIEDTEYSGYNGS